MYPNIRGWNVAEFQGAIPGFTEIRWEKTGSSEFADVTIEKYVLHHSRVLELPLLYIHKSTGTRQNTVLWLGEKGKATSEDWANISKYLEQGLDVISFDPRGMGETRMPYKAVSPDDPALAQLDFDHAYVNPLSGSAGRLWLQRFAYWKAVPSPDDRRCGDRHPIFQGRD